MGVTPSTRESRDVHIEVPAKPDYLVLARLALSAICRLTPLEHNEVADLKLAVTEAASQFVKTDGNTEAQISFYFRLTDDRLELELRGGVASTQDSEQELSRAIVEATVDEMELDAEHALLVKRIPAG